LPFNKGTKAYICILIVFMRFIFFLLFIAVSGFTQNIQGIVFEAHSNGPIKGVKILILPDNISVFSAEDGTFKIVGLKLGRKTAVIEKENYKTLSMSEVLVQAGKESIINASLEVLNTNLEEVNVNALKNRTLANVQTITAEQVLRLPATYFDPARLIVNFPGVAGANDQANGTIIHGNSPDASAWRLEGAEIVNPNHLTNAGTVSDRPTLTAGGQNILSAQMLGETAFYSGALPAALGNATSGLIDMTLRPGNLYARNHTIQAGVIGLDLSTEGPIKNGRSSYLINYRYSFTGVLAKMGVRFGGEAIDFQDAGLTLYFKTKNNGQVKLFGLWGNSNNIYESPAVENPSSKKEIFNIDYSNTMGLGGLQYKGRLGFKTGLSSTLVLSGLAADRRAQTIASYATKGLELDAFEQKIANFRTVLKTSLNPSTVLTYGTGLSLNMQQFESKTDIFNIQLNASPSRSLFYLDPFVDIEKQITKKLKVQVGTRLFSILTEGLFRPEPRAFAKYAFTKNIRFVANYGVQSQIQKIMYGSIKPTLSQLGSMGFEGNIKQIFWQITAYKQFTKYVPVTQADRIASINTPISGFNEIENTIYNEYTATGFGKNTGVDMGLQRYLTKGWYGIVSSSVYKVLFSNSGEAYSPGRYNGRYTNAIVLGKEWHADRKWTFGANGRMAYNGGYLEPAIDVPASIARKATVYKYAQGYTERLPDFFRVDLRFYANKNLKHRTNAFSLDIQNATAQQNRSFSYFDAVAGKIVKPMQMGLVPLMSYRINL
jgi:hypothetical protein